MRMNFYALKYFFLVFSKKFSNPTFIYKNINEINTDLLTSKGIRAIIFDIDQTLSLPNQNEIYPLFIEKYNELKKYFKICALTNQGLSLTPEESFRRKEIFQKKYNIKVILPDKKKPDPSGFNIAIIYLNVDRDKVLFVGDRIMTDIIGANLARIKSVLVEPIKENKDVFVIRFLRFFERKVVKILMYF